SVVNPIVLCSIRHPPKVPPQTRASIWRARPPSTSARRHFRTERPRSSGRTERKARTRCAPSRCGYPQRAWSPHLTAPRPMDRRPAAGIPCRVSSSAPAPTPGTRTTTGAGDAYAALVGRLAHLPSISSFRAGPSPADGYHRGLTSA
ncbi:hypothetical protein K523DRAFT_382514, partial [Schizophyllum commune Tattone D]